MPNELAPDVAGELAGLAEKAKPGPWEAIKGVEASDDMRCGISAMRGGIGYLVVTIENGAPGDFCDTEEANARMIVALVNNLPAILTALTSADAMRAENVDLKAALQNLSDSADEINGEQDAQLYDERGRVGWEWGDDYKTEVTICEGQWRKLNVDLCAAQQLLKILARSAFIAAL